VGGAAVVGVVTIRDARGAAATWIAGSTVERPPTIASPTTTTSVSATVTAAAGAPESLWTRVSSVAEAGAGVSIAYEMSTKMFFVSV
jgi:hypothetical protein